MKQILLLLLSCAFSTGIFAQIEVTNATFPALEDTLLTVTTFSPANLSPGDSGAEVTWDFSSLSGGNDNETIYQDAVEGSAAAELPNANLLVNNLATETYYQKTDTEFLILAGKGEDPTGFGVEALVRFMPPIVERRAPMNFGDVNTTESDANFAFGSDVVPDSLLDGIPFTIDSIRIRINQTRTDVVDAFGMVTIPGGTYEVLREKRSQTRSTRVDVLSFLGWSDVTDIIAGLIGVDAGLGEVLTVNYLYFNDEEKEIIANIAADESGDIITSVTYKFIDLLDDTDDIALDQSQVMASPNPASTEVIFNFSDIEAGDYQLKIFNVLGQNVWQQDYSLNGNQTATVNLSDFQNGTYIYSILNEKGQTLLTKQLVVLK